MLSASNDVVLPIIAKTLEEISLSFKDPALFDTPTASFAVFMGQQILGRTSGGLVFITLRAVSENSTHVLITGYAKEPFKNHMAVGLVKKARDAITANVP